MMHQICNNIRLFYSSSIVLRLGQDASSDQQQEALWEAQDGYLQPSQPEKVVQKHVLDTNDEKTKVQRPKLVSGDRPKTWRPVTSSKRSHSPRAVSRRPYPPSYDRQDHDATKNEFRQLFEHSKADTEDAEIEDEVGTFDIDKFRDQVKILHRGLLEAYRHRNVAQGERHFQFLLRLQKRIPQDLDELHMLCKPLWVSMMDLYIEYGEYQSLKPFLERFSLTYGQHEADRALLTLRHFFSQGLLHLAKNFWNDADKANILDERAYAETIHWMNDKGYITDARAIINAALVRSQTDPNFVLTVYFYNAAIRFAIHQLNIHLLQDLLNRMKLKVPFGLGLLSFVTWLHSINNLTFFQKMPKSEIVGDEKNALHAAPDKRVVQLQPLLEIQHQLFSTVLLALDSFSIRIDDALRDEIIRHDITQADSLLQMLEVIPKYTTAPDVRILDYMVDSLILHQEFPDLQRLLEESSVLGLAKPAKTTFRIIAKWTFRLLDPSTVELAAAKPHLPRVNSAQSLSNLLGAHSVPLYLFEIGFLSQEAFPPSPPLLARILLHILDSIRGLSHQERRHRHVDLQKALHRVFEPLYASDELGLPDDTHSPYEILLGLFGLEFYKEAEQFAYYCQHRLSPSVVGGILALRMTQLEKWRHWERIDDLWHFAVDRGIVRRPHLLHVYVQSLLHRKPLNLQRTVAFISSVINRSVSTSPIIHYEILQLIYRMRPEGFDVPAFWALESVRRSLRIPIDSRIASLVSKILTTYGDVFIKSEACTRLHADFDAFIAQSKNRHFSGSLDSHEVSMFEDAFDRWYSIFLAAVPVSNRTISPYILPQHQYRSDVATKATPIFPSLNSL